MKGMVRERFHFSSLSIHRSVIALGDRLVGFGPKSTAKRATLWPSASPLPGIHQKRPRATKTDDDPNGLIVSFGDDILTERLGFKAWTGGSSRKRVWSHNYLDYKDFSH